MEATNTYEVKTEIKTETENPGLPEKPKSGMRQIGQRKLRLLLSLQKTMQDLQKKGINATYALRKFTDYKGPLRTTTKKLSGIISELKQFSK